VFQLRYLQTLNSISAENNSTIIFPVPIDILSNFMNLGNNNDQNMMARQQPQPYKQNPAQNMSKVFLNSFSNYYKDKTNVE
jgi:hypothetical protein